MTEIARFLDLVSYTETDMADFHYRLMRPQGILPESTLGTLTVTAPGGMNVRVGPGEAFIQGFQYINDANKDLSIGANSSGSLRVDTVVLRLDRTANLLTAVIKAGTPGAGAPALTQVAGGTWEFPLYDVQVANGAASIVIGNITPDRRVYSRWQKEALDDELDTIAARVSGDNALDLRLDVIEALPKVTAIAVVDSAGAFVRGKNISSTSRSGVGNYTVIINGVIPANAALIVTSWIFGVSPIATFSGGTLVNVRGMDISTHATADFSFSLFLVEW